jgi:hypothetical protein
MTSFQNKFGSTAAVSCGGHRLVGGARQLAVVQADSCKENN